MMLRNVGNGNARRVSTGFFFAGGLPLPSAGPPSVGRGLVLELLDRERIHFDIKGDRRCICGNEL